MTKKSTTFRVVNTLHDAEIPQPPPKMNNKIREKDIFEGAVLKKKEKKSSKKGTPNSSK